MERLQAGCHKCSSFSNLDLHLSSRTPCCFLLPAASGVQGGEGPVLRLLTTREAAHGGGGSLPARVRQQAGLDSLSGCAVGSGCLLQLAQQARLCMPTRTNHGRDALPSCPFSIVCAH